MSDFSVSPELRAAGIKGLSQSILDYRFKGIPDMKLVLSLPTPLLLEASGLVKLAQDWTKKNDFSDSADFVLGYPLERNLNQIQAELLRRMSKKKKEKKRK